MGLFSLFNRENKIKKVVNEIAYLARHSPERFFIKHLNEYKDTNRENEHFSILHNLFSIHLERRGVFESEFDYINRNENIKNKIDLEVRRIFDHIQKKEIIIPDISYNDKKDVYNSILILHEKYLRNPSDFFLALGLSRYMSSLTEEEKAGIINQEFIQILNYYGISFNEINSDHELMTIYNTCVLKLIPKIKSQYK